MIIDYLDMSLLFMFNLKVLISLTTVLAASYAVSNPPELPIYVGQSYNLIGGNPLSSTIDPGFNQLIFNEVYSQNKTT